MQARRITVLALLAGLTLAGCGEDEPAPKVEPTASSTPTPSPTAPVEPTLPPEAEGTSKAAAEAFVRHYYATLDYAQSAGTTAPLRALSHNLCIPCDGGADALDRIAKLGGSIEGGEHLVESAASSRTSGPPFYDTRIKVAMVTTDQVVAGTGSRFDGAYPGNSGTFLVDVVREKDQWKVMDWERVDS